MAESFAEMMRNQERSIEELTAELDKVNKGNFENDDRFWYPQVDKEGNGYAVIRFLPAPKGETNRFVKIFSHNFQGPGGWYIEECLTSIGLEDPVAELNNRLWATGTEANKKLASKQKRKLGFISNVLVITDPKDPKNEGQVKLFRYGKKIFEKINEKAFPKFPGEIKMDAFNPISGANFILKIRKVEGYRNYEKCEFDRPAPIGSNEYIEELWNREYPLKEFTDPAHFKSYDELKKKLNKVLGGDPGFVSKAETSEATELRSKEPSWNSGVPPWEGPDELESDEVPPPEVASGADKDLEYFKSLAFK